MIAWLHACAVPATLYPTDACRVSAEFAAFSAEVSCDGGDGPLSATFAGERAARVGGVQGAGWEGLSFFADAVGTEGELVTVGWRPETIGFAAVRDDVEVEAGFSPTSGDSPDAPWLRFDDGSVSCDAATGSGAVELRGLPDAWIEGGTWSLEFDAGEGSATAATDEWNADWPAGCPLSSRSWATVRMAAGCDGTTLAEAQFLAPESWAVELDELGAAASVSAAWGPSFSASCAGTAIDATEASLEGAGDLELRAPHLSLVRESGTWRVDTTSCGACSAWDVEVEGLPEF